MTLESRSPDVSAILTAHREGLLAAPSARSALAAIAHAEKQGISCELVVVLDRADDLTRSVLGELVGDAGRILEASEGDPGLARNLGVAASHGLHASFLDGDDLWSGNWLSEAHSQSTRRPDAIFHSACNLTFGEKRLFFWHNDSECALCDNKYLIWYNYWDSLCFARRELLLRYPYKANDLELGFGHEDWHWNAVTLADGIAHKPVPGTMHFKRARQGSQMSKVDSISGFRWPVSTKRGFSAVEES